MEAIINRSNNSINPTTYTACDTIMRYAEFLGFGDFYTKIDEKTGLKAIIAIHNLKLGPAIGGCRLYSYPTVDLAYEDALRLAHMMSYKAAINNLPHGGAKAVLIKPKIIKDRRAYFEKFAEFVHELGGRYITAVDMGTTTADMDVIVERTPYVTCTTAQGGSHDPSPLTALGVRRAIEAAVQFKLGRDSLDGIHVAVQGAGHVGYYLTQELIALGAHVTVTDVNEQALERVVGAFGVNTCPRDAIYDIDADIFAPCALGAVLNAATIKRLKVKIVAGSANNQLAHHKHADLLHEKNILYAPDFLINAGGLIHVAAIYDHGNHDKAMAQIHDMYNTVYGIFEKSKQADQSPNKIAEEIARERLKFKEK
ncbi:MAG: hypothetical protein A3F12_05110 [Gammaproteobacteria bacterium RIFCSPHIGHO2_12_FULL_38_14]|nr:MAG: hypothetical protein A3F12_05110 [Gammaproteobacteria bacterium RIFCSPHIGHO2_12_FULL_38_14]